MTTKTDINQVAQKAILINRTSGISEEVLKTLNLKVRKEVITYNSYLKEFYLSRRRNDIESARKAEEKINNFTKSVEKGDLVKSIISDLNKEMGVDNVFSHVKDTVGVIVEHSKIGEAQQINGALGEAQQINGDLVQNVESKIENYVQQLVENLVLVNRTKIDYTFKNKSPFSREGDINVIIRANN